MTQAIAAIRESFEELGVLLARHADGSWATQAEVDATGPARRLWRPVRGARPDAGRQRHACAGALDHRPRPAQRFDVPFLVARMPEGQTPVADETEQFEPVWVRPGDALARHEAGSF